NVRKQSHKSLNIIEIAVPLCSSQSHVFTFRKDLALYFHEKIIKKYTFQFWFFFVFILAVGMITTAWCAESADLIRNKKPDTIRIALVHLNSQPGEVTLNRSRIEAAINEAVLKKADWILTPELAETGYGFVKKIGTNWIENFPNDWIRRLSGMARISGVTLFIGLAEKDSTTGKLHNSVAVIGRDGVIHGTYRKHRVIKGPAERWATPGQENNLFIIDGIPVGLLICADSYKAEVAIRHKLQGARILLSPANWPQSGHMGPKNYWETRTQETGLPLIVNNRTGREPDLDFTTGESTLVISGHRVFKFKSDDTKIFYLDWKVKKNSFAIVP
ncbi:MAG: carbon-nitrogen hydrolase family protein, partial [Smithella sp.]